MSFLSSAHALLRFMATTYTAVSYIKVGGADIGAAFGPEFSTEEDCWKWLHGLGDTPCQAPPHDYIEVEPAVVA